MTYSRRITCFVLLSICCVAGCAKQHGSLNGHVRFEIDGTEYGFFRFVETDMRGRADGASFIVVYAPWGKPPSMDSSFTSGTGQHQWFIKADGERFAAKTDTVYYITDGKVIVVKTYQDLGINVPDLNADLEPVLKKVQPILEKLIRENEKPIGTGEKE